MCVMVTGLIGTEDFQQWVLMSNELVMATCTVNNKETTNYQINWKHAHKQIIIRTDNLYSHIINNLFYELMEFMCTNKILKT